MHVVIADHNVDDNDKLDDEVDFLEPIIIRTIILNLQCSIIIINNNLLLSLCISSLIVEHEITSCDPLVNIIKSNNNNMYPECLHPSITFL